MPPHLRRNARTGISYVDGRKLGMVDYLVGCGQFDLNRTAVGDGIQSVRADRSQGNLQLIRVGRYNHRFGHSHPTNAHVVGACLFGKLVRQLLDYLHQIDALWN